MTVKKGKKEHQEGRGRTLSLTRKRPLGFHYLGQRKKKTKLEKGGGATFSGVGGREEREGSRRRSSTW